MPAAYGGLAGTTFTHSVVVTEEIQKQFLALGGLRVQTCTEMQGRAVDRCLQLHGKAGDGLDTRIGRAYADGRVSRIYGGSSEIMKVIVARALGH